MECLLHYADVSATALTNRNEENFCTTGINQCAKQRLCASSKTERSIAEKRSKLGDLSVSVVYRLALFKFSKILIFQRLRSVSDAVFFADFRIVNKIFLG